MVILTRFVRPKLWNAFSDLFGFASKRNEHSIEYYEKNDELTFEGKNSQDRVSGVLVKFYIKIHADKSVKNNTV